MLDIVNNILLLIIKFIPYKLKPNLIAQAINKQNKILYNVFLVKNSFNSLFNLFFLKIFTIIKIKITNEITTQVIILAIKK